MNKNLLGGLALLAMFQIGKAQSPSFYPNEITDAFNAFGENFSAAGTARYIGMGESMGALGGDLSAVETNPAGLGIFRSSVANLSLNVSSVKNTASMGNGSHSNSLTHLNLSESGFVFAMGDEEDPIKINLGANLSYQRLNNEVIFSPNSTLNYLYKDVKGDEQLYYMEGYKQLTDGYRSKMKISVAANYLDKLYFGAGLDWYYLNIDRSSVYSHKGENGKLMNFDEQYTPYNQAANGFGLNVGVIGKVTPEVRLGAAYHSPVWWSDIEDYRWIYGYDDSKDEYFGDYVYFDRYKNVSPGKIVLSGAYASNIINDNNSLAFNIDFINYFNKDIKFKGDDPDYRLNNNFVSNYVRNSQEYRLGAEYRFKEIKLRAGYGYTTSPVKDTSVSGIFITPNSNFAYVKNYLEGEKNKFSLGAGYDIGSYFIDLGYQLIKTSYYTSLSGNFYNPYINEALVDYFDVNTPFLGKVKNTQNNFVLTLGMRF
ncbi:MAG: outer membrane protein transport protein [Flavobacteriaceae bacterium]|jgi:long-subunit fatty acid transport protein|nr:outer membrane protein transport protein [Flavobacteriaceae bacterium]